MDLGSNGLVQYIGFGQVSVRIEPTSWPYPTNTRIPHAELSQLAKITAYPPQHYVSPLALPVSLKTGSVSLFLPGCYLLTFPKNRPVGQNAHSDVVYTALLCPINHWPYDSPVANSLPARGVYLNYQSQYFKVLKSPVLTSGRGNEKYIPIRK